MPDDAQAGAVTKVMRQLVAAALEFRAMNNFPRYTDMDPEIIEARAKIEAVYERFKAYANGPQPDPETVLRMKSELEVMANSCPSWVNVSCMEPEDRARVLSYLNGWPDAT
jgi:hypothetical protein